MTGLLKNKDVFHKVRPLDDIVPKQTQTNKLYRSEVNTPAEAVVSLALVTENMCLPSALWQFTPGCFFPFIRMWHDVAHQVSASLLFSRGFPYLNIKGKPEPRGCLAYDFLLYWGATTKLSDRNKAILGYGASVVHHLCHCTAQTTKSSLITFSWLTRIADRKEGTCSWNS